MKQEKTASNSREETKRSFVKRLAQNYFFKPSMISLKAATGRMVSLSFSSFGGVVATEVDGGALDVEKRLLNLASLGLEGLSNRLEGLSQLGVVRLCSQLLGPVEGQEEVGAAVVVLAHLAGRGLALIQQGLGGLVQGSGQDASLGVAVGVVLVAEGLSQGQELAEGIPAQVVLLLDLLDVLRGGAAGTGLEQAAALRNAG